VLSKVTVFGKSVEWFGSCHLFQPGAISQAWLFDRLLPASRK
jgi:hypothetical protein